MFRFMAGGVRSATILVLWLAAWLTGAPLVARATASNPASAKQQAAARPFRAGAATSNITPPLGCPIVGGFAPFPATHVHDELHARCLVLDDGATKLVLVVCDLLGIDRQVSEEARALLKQDLGIPPENVLISATHTHSACSALGKDARIISHTMDEYQRFVARRIVDGVKRAVNLLRPAQIAWGTAEAPQHVFNRRWHMKPGTMPPNPFGGIDQVKMNPPAGSPNLLEPAGPTDPAIAFIALREPGGKPIAVYSTYSLHYVGGVGPGHISADYFGMYCDALARLLETQGQTPAFVALMANGTSGDINNINFRKPRSKQEPYAQMKFVAEDVAQTVHAALAKLRYRDQVTLAARYREPDIATRQPTQELVAWAKKTLAERPRVPGKTDLTLVYAERTLRMAEHPGKLKLPLQALRIGDVALGTMPCEIFCEIGLEFKKRSPLQPAWLVSLSHGYYGYLPTPRHHELGGYETWLGTNRLEVQASEKMLANLLQMADELR
jgi:neutral ceramidase